MKPGPPPAELVARASERHAALVLGTLVDGTTTRHLAGRSPPAWGALFQIGSVTKTFTALLLARQVVRGELRLDDPLGPLLPAAAPVASGVGEITLGQLATHTSRLPRLPPGLWRRALGRARDPYADIDEEALLAALARVRLRRRPHPHYSNLGYGLLGHVLARAAGTTYDELLRTEVTAPLGLHDTVLYPNEEQRGRVAPGHTRRLRPRSVTWSFDALAGAGALWSTAPDLLTYAAAHLDPQPGELGEALRLVLEPRVSHRGMGYALAWLRPPKVTRIEGVFHNGGVDGYRSALVIEPGRRRASVALTSTDRSVDALAMQALGQAKT